METLKFHPLCSLLPALPDDELDALVEDIRENGLKRPITLLNDMVLDGRHRLAACRLAGVEPVFEVWNGNGNPAKYVASMNVRRRHLTESQKAMILHRLAETAAENSHSTDEPPENAQPIDTKEESSNTDNFRPAGGNSTGKRKSAGRPRKSKSVAAQVALAAGVSERQIERAARVQRDAPEVADRVADGEISLRAAELQIAPPNPPDDGESLRAEIRRLVEQIEVKIAAFCQTPAGAKHDRIEGLHRLAGIVAWINGRKRRAAVKASGERDGQISVIYAAYPRQNNPVAAKTAIGKALDIVPFHELLDAVREYAEATESWSEADRQFIPYPQKWFNQRRWEEDRAGWRRATKRKPSKTAGIEEFAANAARRGREVEPGVELIGGDDAALPW